MADHSESSLQQDMEQVEAAIARARTAVSEAEAVRVNVETWRLAMTKDVAVRVLDQRVRDLEQQLSSMQQQFQTLGAPKSPAPSEGQPDAPSDPGLGSVQRALVDVQQKLTRGLAAPKSLILGTGWQQPTRQPVGPASEIESTPMLVHGGVRQPVGVPELMQHRSRDEEVLVSGMRPLPAVREEAHGGVWQPFGVSELMLMILQRMVADRRGGPRL